MRRVRPGDRSRGRATRVRLAVALALAALAGGCRGCTSSRPPFHLNPNMDDPPRLETQGPSTFFYDGKAMRRPVEGTVAREDPVALDAAVTGLGADGAPVAEMPGGVTAERAARGRDRFAIFCSPCHGQAADGRGMLFDRAGVESADLLSDRVAAMPDGQIFDTVTHGFGLMAGYGTVLPPEDRWAVIAYLRRLESGEETP